MADASPIQSQPSPFRNDIIALVASQDLDTVPDEFDPPERFVINSIRAATRRSDLSSMCAFVYSEAPRPDTIELGFSRIAHMQDGYGELSGYIVATNQDVNNGMSRLCSQASPNRIMEELEEMSLHERPTVIWDPKSSVATIYPSGVASPDDHIRKPINVVDTDLTRDEVNSALTIAYEENLKTPSAHTARLWVKLTLVERAEDELERHIKGQLTTFFLGRQRPIKVCQRSRDSDKFSTLVGALGSGTGLFVWILRKMKMMAVGAVGNRAHAVFQAPVGALCASMGAAASTAPALAVGTAFG